MRRKVITFRRAKQLAEMKQIIDVNAFEERNLETIVFEFEDGSELFVTATLYGSLRFETESSPEFVDAVSAVKQEKEAQLEAFNYLFMTRKELALIQLALTELVQRESFEDDYRVAFEHLRERVAEKYAESIKT